MIEIYISKLNFSSLKTEKIEAIEVPVDGLSAYLYYDYMKQLHFIIKSEEKIFENRKGIKVKNTVLDLIDLGQNTFIDCICTNDDFKSEFIQIIEQIIEHFKQSANLTKSIKIIINKWYYFFEKDSITNLTEFEIKGLIGELIFIKNYLSKFGHKLLLNAWKGPESGLRDFNFDKFDVEVKSSSKEIGHIHTINGQIQLKADNVPLFIYSISLKRSASENAISLKKLVDEICLALSEDEFLLNDFFEKLEMTNLLVSKVELYNSFSYELKEILTIKINKENLKEFIIENQNNRISNLKYDYDFNGITNTEIQRDEKTI
jgi:hypothetical protein